MTFNRVHPRKWVDRELIRNHGCKERCESWNDVSCWKYQCICTYLVLLALWRPEDTLAVPTAHIRVSHCIPSDIRGNIAMGVETQILELLTVSSILLICKHRVRAALCHVLPAQTVPKWHVKSNRCSRTHSSDVFARIRCWPSDVAVEYEQPSLTGSGHFRRYHGLVVLHSSRWDSPVLPRTRWYPFFTTCTLVPITSVELWRISQIWPIEIWMRLKSS